MPIFWGFGMIRPRIESPSRKLLANTALIRPIISSIELV